MESRTYAVLPPRVQRLAVRWGLLFVILAGLLSGASGIGCVAKIVPIVARVLDSPLPFFQSCFMVSSASPDVVVQRVLDLGYNIGLALLGAIIWSFFDRSTTHERVLYELLRATTRYILACSMLTYGMSKVFPAQFPPPGPVDWVRSIGEIAPNSFLGVFMGYSPTYRVFAGLVEVVSALLLLFRQTSTLGALIACGALGNILLLDYGFRFEGMEWAAGQLLAMSVFLVAADGRLINLFLLNRPTSAVTASLDWNTRRARFTRLAVGALLCVSWAFHPEMRTYFENSWNLRQKSELRGVYYVESFRRNAPVGLPNINQSQAWRILAIDDYCHLMVVRTMDDGELRFEITRPDTNGHEESVVNAKEKVNLSLISRSSESDWVGRHEAGTAALARSGTNQLILEAYIDGSALSVDLQRLDEDQRPRGR